MALLQLIYASAATHRFAEAELQTLLIQARERNAVTGITGILLYHKRSFLQVLEGEADPVLETYDRILADRRHEELLILLSGPIKERSFPDFRMGFVSTVPEKMRSMPGYTNFFSPGAPFLPLPGDSMKTARIITGFREGKWHQALAA